MADYVLVVDDYPDVRNLVVNLLNQMGMESRQAVNGEKALEMIDLQEPRAIVLDLVMPVMSGFAMLTQLSGRKASQPIPVILLSGVADDSQMKALPGVVGVLKKGAFTIEELRDLLTKAIALGRPAADTRPLTERPEPERPAITGYPPRLI
jgi:CheY-like chemotaxis protein